jgi:hypothetical protein
MYPEKYTINHKFFKTLCVIIPVASTRPRINLNKKNNNKVQISKTLVKRRVKRNFFSTIVQSNSYLFQGSKVRYFRHFFLVIFYMFFLMRLTIRFGLAEGGGGTGVTTQRYRAAATDSEIQVKVLS